jgi:hypothetical protein
MAMAFRRGTSRAIKGAPWYSLRVFVFTLFFFLHPSLYFLCALCVPFFHLLLLTLFPPLSSYERVA